MSEFTSIHFVFWFACALSSAVICSWLFYLMRVEVNAKLTEQEQIGPLFGYPGLLTRVERLHRQFYPKSRLRMVLNTFIVLGLA